MAEGWCGSLVVRGIAVRGYEFDVVVGFVVKPRGEVGKWHGITWGPRELRAKCP